MVRQNVETFYEKSWNMEIKNTCVRFEVCTSLDSKGCNISAWGLSVDTNFLGWLPKFLVKHSVIRYEKNRQSVSGWKMYPISLCQLLVLMQCLLERIFILFSIIITIIGYKITYKKLQENKQ